MSDLVERLRRGEPCREGCGAPCRTMDAASGCICAEAADRIEQLEAALRQIAGIDVWDNSDQGYVDKARAALEGKQMTDITIPPEALAAMRAKLPPFFSESMARAACLALLAAWPGMEEARSPRLCCQIIILPLPKENING